MDKLLKFYDDEINFEGFIIVNDNLIDDVVRILEEYRKNEYYNWDDFLDILKEKKIKFNTLRVVKLYF